MVTIGRRDVTKALAGAALSTLAPCEADTAGDTRKPNVLYVLSDQHRASALGCYGESAIATPNFDRFAAEGIRCTNTVCNTPLCSPSRATLQTGLYPQSHKILTNKLHLDTRFPSIGKSFRDAGYATGYIGKWHLFGLVPTKSYGFIPPGPDRFGYEYWAAFEGAHRYYDFQYYHDDPEPIREKGYEPNRQTELAQEFIKQHKDEPWCLGISWGPHADPVPGAVESVPARRL